MKRNLMLIILAFLFQNSFAQLETAVWYFGNNAGLNFRTPEPKVLLDGALANWEGVASFSDSLGNLLFYTDGRTIWNRAHKIMKNGEKLIGHQSSTESAIIVPQPKSKTKYLVFVVDAYRGDKGLSYSVVDMSLDGGMGAVTEIKNEILESRVGEKVTAIRHANNVDFWLISRLDPGNEIVEYLITKDGLLKKSRKTFPISILYLPDLFDDEYAIYNDLSLGIGYMRVSPDGKKIACAMQGSSIIDADENLVNVLEIFDFNPENGLITNYLTYLDRVNFLYGVEFSNDVSKLYFSNRRSIFQMDLTAGTPDDVYNSIIKVGEFPIFPSHSTADTNYVGALQLALNGKIYVAQDNYPYLGVIENPREKGLDCGYKIDGQYLGGRVSRMGLPNFVPSYFLPPNFEIFKNCNFDATQFICTDKREISKYQWVLSALDGTTIAKSALRNFDVPIKETGTYKITLTITVNGVEHSDYRFFDVYETPYFELQSDTLICSDGQANIRAVVPKNCTFSWLVDGENSSSNDDILYIKTNSKIIETVKDIYTQCEYSDSVFVKVTEPEKFTLGKDTAFCKNSLVILDFNIDDSKFQNFKWLDNNSEEIKREFSEIGEYVLQSFDYNKCYFTDTISISEYSLPEIDFSNDSIFCDNLENFLDCKVENAQYSWNTGDATQIIRVNKPGKYTVIVTDSNNCKSTSSVDLKLKTLPKVDIVSDTCFCEGETLVLDVNWSDATQYIWQDFTESDHYEITSPGTYVLETTNICGVSTDTISVTSKYCGEMIIPNIITPNNDGQNDEFKIKGLTDGWSLTIFTREGVKVYATDNYDNKWNAPGLSDGVYFYILEKPGKRYTGNITVFHRQF